MGTPTFNDINLMIARINGQTAPPGLRPPRVERAFVTHAAFSVGDHAYPAVVTGGYTNGEAGEFEVNFDILGYSGCEDPISLTIDRQDVEAMRDVLGIGGEADGSGVSDGWDRGPLSVEGINELDTLMAYIYPEVSRAHERWANEDVIMREIVGIKPAQLRRIGRTAAGLAVRIAGWLEEDSQRERQAAEYEGGGDATQNDS